LPEHIEAMIQVTAKLHADHHEAATGPQRSVERAVVLL